MTQNRTQKKINSRPMTKLLHRDLPLHRGIREGSLFLITALALFLLISLLSYDAQDGPWSYSETGHQIKNAGGVAGAWFSDIFFHLIGILAYLIPLIILLSGGILFLLHPGTLFFEEGILIIRSIGCIMAILSGAALASLHFPNLAISSHLDAGGMLGEAISGSLTAVFSEVGATLFLLAFLLPGLGLLTGLSWLKLMDITGQAILDLKSQADEYKSNYFQELAENRSQKQLQKELSKPSENVVDLRKKQKSYAEIENSPTEPTRILKNTIEHKINIEDSEKLIDEVEKKRQPPIIQTQKRIPPPSVSKNVNEIQNSLNEPSFPGLNLLDLPEEVKEGFTKEKLEAMSILVEEKLRDFRIEVEVVSVLPGPVVTRFEMQPAPGVKVSQITSLVKDLARALSVISVRVVEVIAGKSVIGLEIPNEYKEMIYLSEIVSSREFEKSKSPLTMVLGKDIAGTPVVADLSKMPHLLVAGTTGSGKSVGVNAMIVSMLYKSMPKDVRFIMIDPKMLELSVYQDIPHLLAPVVTDMENATTALAWCVNEMENRYRLLASQGVRNIAGYNTKIKQAIDNNEPIPHPFYRPPEVIDEDAPIPIHPTLEHIPFIVVVVDEFADLVMVVGKKVEELIARLAQKARACGIHLILATQRPSVNVLTGLIKANIPTRISFQVSSKIDSRTILDQMGAEQLLGHGDMLFLPPGKGMPVRVHGAFVSDSEVHKVVAQIKTWGKADYIEGIFDSPSNSADSSDYQPNADSGGETDPLYDEAVNIVIETRRASISNIQRRLKVGYNRAARMIEDMENAGLVSSMQTNGNREVLIPLSE